MKQIVVRFLAIVALLCPTLSLGDTLRFGDSSLGGETSVDAEFLPVEQAYQVIPRMAGNALRLQWQIAPGYYLYRERFAAELIDGAASQSLPLAFEEGVVRYDDYYQKDVEVYYDGTEVLVQLPPLEETATIRIDSQGCADAGLCYPPRSQYLKVDPAGQSAVLTEAPAGGATSSTPAGGGALVVILAFALAGGVILNLMPCVFPVLSIKVLSLTGSGLNPHRRHVHGLAYTGGVVVTFTGVALLLIALRAGGEALGWGFQLQSPLFISALIYLFFIMGLSFSGIFVPGSRLMSLGQSRAGGEGLHHSFLTGVLATVVASPCSAPFMGTALGFALTQSAPVALLVFATLGLGMALPFLLLTWAPGLLKRLPRPGPWMETLKEALAFPLYLTCVWLLWILGHQAGSDTLVAVVLGLVLLAFAIWLAGKGRFMARLVASLAVIGALLTPVWTLNTESREALWEPYSEARLDSLLADRRSVFVNLTADWCITCLANEKVALNSDEFADLLAAEDIVYLKGDWTNRNPEITALLNANGRNGVPLYLFYANGQKPPHILPQILTKSIVLDALTNSSRQ